MTVLNCIRKTYDVIFISNLIAWFLVVKICTHVCVCIEKLNYWSLFLTQLTAKSHFFKELISAVEQEALVEAPGINYAEIGEM